MRRIVVLVALFFLVLVDIEARPNFPVANQWRRYNHVHLQFDVQTDASGKFVIDLQKLYPAKDYTNIPVSCYPDPAAGVYKGPYINYDDDGDHTITVRTRPGLKAAHVCDLAIPR